MPDVPWVRVGMIVRMLPWVMVAFGLTLRFTRVMRRIMLQASANMTFYVRRALGAQA